MTATAETQAPDAAYEQLAERLDEQIAANERLAAENDRLAELVSEARPMVDAHRQHVQRADFVPDCAFAVLKASNWLAKAEALTPEEAAA